MARVDFYLLTNKDTPERFTCAIIEKARKQGNRIHIHTNDKQQAGSIDEMLWTYKDISFLPHTIVEKNTPNDYPISIAWAGLQLASDDVLINLSTSIPDFAGSFSRIIEIVAAQDDLKEQAREKYKSYRKQSFDLHSHDLESKHAST